MKAKGSTFKAGHMVKLRTGGPEMTVAMVYPGDMLPSIECMWFEGSKLHHGSFVPATLKFCNDEVPEQS